MHLFLDFSRTYLASTHLKEENEIFCILFLFTNTCYIADYSACVSDFFASVDVKLLTMLTNLQLMDMREKIRRNL